MCKYREVHVFDEQVSAIINPMKCYRLNLKHVPYDGVYYVPCIIT